MKNKKESENELIMHKREFVQEQEVEEENDVYDYNSLDNFYDDDEIDFVELNFLCGYNMAI